MFFEEDIHIVYYDEEDDFNGCCCCPCRRRRNGNGNGNGLGDAIRLGERLEDEAIEDFIMRRRNGRRHHRNCR